MVYRLNIIIKYILRITPRKSLNSKRSEILKNPLSHLLWQKTVLHNQYQKIKQLSNHKLYKTKGNKNLSFALKAVIVLTTHILSYNFAIGLINNNPASTDNLITENESLITQDNLNKTQELLLAFSVNGIEKNYVDIVLKKNNEVYLSENSIKKLNFNENKLNKDNINYYNKKFFKISNSNDISINIKQATSAIEITAKPELFNQTVIEPQNTWYTPTIPGSGGYINYDVIYSRAQKPISNGLKALLNPTIFYKQNIVTSDFKVDYNSTDNPSKKQFVRLESKVIRDFPKYMTSLTVGDGRTNVDLWGQPVLFGGIQYSTNFSLQPGFIYYPLPDVQGVATLPSAIDLYINDTNRHSKNIKEGPFEILEIPTIGGGGEIKVVQKDLLGTRKHHAYRN